MYIYIYVIYVFTHNCIMLYIYIYASVSYNGHSHWGNLLSVIAMSSCSADPYRDDPMDIANEFDAGETIGLDHHMVGKLLETPWFPVLKGNMDTPSSLAPS